jgi:hypothetical protein
MGALNQRAVLADGEWYRLFAMTFLHADVWHLLLNCLTLFFVGLIVEVLLGWAWFVTVFFLCGIAGSLVSMALDPADALVVGASGAILGLGACGLVVTFRLPHSNRRTALIVGELVLLGLACIPQGGLSFGCHLGGTLAGAILGFTALSAGANASGARPLLPVARTLTAVALTVYGVILVTELRHYRSYAESDQLMPDGIRVADETEARARLPELLRRYPRDPRARIVAATLALGDGDPARAQAHLLGALSDPGMLRLLRNDDLTAEIGDLLQQLPRRTAAAATLRHRGR